MIVAGSGNSKKWGIGKNIFVTDASEDERDDDARDDDARDKMISDMKEGKSGYGMDPKRKEASLYYYMPLKIEESGETWYVVTAVSESVPVSSYKMQKPDNILINIESERYNKVKGSLRFNYMFPVPDECINERIIADDPNKILLNLEWKFCNENETRIRNKAKQTYSKVINKVNPSIVNNSCDFKLLERLCAEYQKQC